MTDGFYHCYREYQLSAAWEEVVHKANAILSQMRAQGYVLTLHQLYYQDELVCEVDKEAGSLDEFERIMSDLPAWAAGCPIVAEADRFERYRK